MALTQVQTAMLGTGAVLQVVNGLLNTQVDVATSSPTNTGLTATITPKFSTSKILILVSHNGIARSGLAYLQSYLLRNSTTLVRFDGSAGYTGSSSTSYLTGSSICFFDSPATTSATTYKTQIANGYISGQVSLNMDSANSTITLLEIAQ